jgi:hypothetical protein
MPSANRKNVLNPRSHLSNPSKSQRSLEQPEEGEEVEETQADYLSNMQSILHPIIGPTKTIEDLTGRVAIITGGAFGIGSVQAYCCSISASYIN